MQESPLIIKQVAHVLIVLLRYNPLLVHHHDVVRIGWHDVGVHTHAVVLSLKDAASIQKPHHRHDECVESEIHQNEDQGRVPVVFEFPVH